MRRNTLFVALAQFSITAAALSAPFERASAQAAALPYPVVGTAQTACYNATAVIACPAAGQPFAGQDAQNSGNRPSYTVSADGLTVLDNVTGLVWQKSPATNADGVLDSKDKLTWAQLQARAGVLNGARFGGYADWRVPTIKELYSLIAFTGTDPSGAGDSTAGLKPFLDPAFDFAWGDTAAGERVIDAQYWSGTRYVSTTMGGSTTVFGVNFADGRIKGYPRDLGPRGTAATEFARLVRGNPSYGVNDLVDNGDRTVTDRATGLTWAKGDSGTGMSWQDALAWVAARNAEKYLGHADWRLPSAKELQSLVDYGRSPDTTASAAISPLLDCTSIRNEAGQLDYPSYWSGTTHAASNGTGGAAVYVAFGRAMGYMSSTWIDVHGAGAQRSDPKAGNPADYPYGRGPQGDAIRILNHVRPVRGGGQGSEPAPRQLLLQNGKVSVTVTYRNQANGEGGEATPIPENENFGYFTYSDRTNPEVFVKVLDFGADRPYLVFTGGLTDFEVHATFTVLRTGQKLTLDKAQGSTTWAIDSTTLAH